MFRNWRCQPLTQFGKIVVCLWFFKISLIVVLSFVRWSWLPRLPASMSRLDRPAFALSCIALNQLMINNLMLFTHPSQYASALEKTNEDFNNCNHSSQFRYQLAISAHLHSSVLSPLISRPHSIASTVEPLKYMLQAFFLTCRNA